MSTSLATALDKPAAPKGRTVLDLLEAQRPAIERALPQAFLRKDPDRFVRVVTTELRRSPGLLECEPASLLGAMMLSAQLGIEPGPLGHVYLVPFKKQVTFILGYKGMIHLANRSGLLKEIVARPVYEGDGFTYRYTDAGDKFVHEPAPSSDRGGVKLYYGRARLRSGGTLVHVMEPDEIEARAKRSPAYRNQSGPWVTDRIAMSCKTVIRAMSPFLPLTAEFGQAAMLDETEPRWQGSQVEVPEAVSEEDGNVSA